LDQEHCELSDIENIYHMTSASCS